jgi:adenine-specific DNA-methyltransferase
VLGGLLLSDVAQFFVECYGVRMRGGYLRFQAQYLRRIRVPRLSQVTGRQAQRLRGAFRSRDVAAATEAALAVYGIEGVPPEVRGGY